MERIKPYFFLAGFILIISCRQNHTNQEPKYQQHHSYKEFLEFLKHKTDSIDSDYDKTTYIRIKTAELIDRGFLDGQRDAKNIDQNWPSWNGERYYNVFLFDSATVICGGSANFLNNIYKDLGYTATTYDMGIPNVHTHQVTLVRPSSNADYNVQDAFFNITFEDAHTRQPLSFNSLIQYLKSKNYSLINVNQADYEFQPTLDTTGISRLKKLKPESKEFLDSISNISRYDFAKLVMKHKKVFERYFLPKGYPDNLLYLYLFPLEHNPQEVNEIVQEELSKLPE